MNTYFDTYLKQSPKNRNRLYYFSKLTKTTYFYFHYKYRSLQLISFRYVQSKKEIILNYGEQTMMNIISIKVF